jgi:hypothetical protein
LKIQENIHVAMVGLAASGEKGFPSRYPPHQIAQPQLFPNPSQQFHALMHQADETSATVSEMHMESPSTWQ